MTIRLIAECPTMKPTFMANDPSIWWKYSSVEVQFQGRVDSRAASGIPSTRASILMMYSTECGAIGAIENPQFPLTTVVTPCSDEGVKDGSQSTAAS